MNDYELNMVTGGKANYSVLAIIGGLITFLIGVVDGFIRPLKCY